MLRDPKELRSAVRHEGGISRRLFFSCMASVAALPLFSECASASSRHITFQKDPFTLGVASGDPDHTGFVLWTRLAPEPLNPDGGMPNERVDVEWELAEDEAMKNIVQSGKVAAIPLLGHSVHIEVTGLKPDRWYWYRFRSGNATSPTGRARTLPEPGSNPSQLNFAFASCQHYEAGYFTAYERMAQDELDLVFHLGDYIYEGPGREGNVRRHIGRKLFTLGDYRVRHSQYRSDPLLQRMHARCPWFVTWDDHEFENNYAADISERRDADPAEFLIQRTNAYQAYYEMMPLRRRSIPRGPDLLLYRKASFGNLAELFVLDTRQYRTDQPNNDRRSELNAAALSPENTLLGAKQREWLQAGLKKSPGRWNVLAQQVMMGMVDRAAGDATGYSMDQWPGYAQERMALMQFCADRKVANPVVLTGDIHSNWVNDLRVDDRKPETPIIGTEFVGTSITSGGNGTDKPAALDRLLAENPGVRFHNQQRGYVRCTVTPGNWRTDYIVVEEVQKPGGKIVNRASFVVEAGKPGAKSA
ncbi:MAG: alkaline phosphatase D family protein [Armatimonadaceae bacterium]